MTAVSPSPQAAPEVGSARLYELYRDQIHRYCLSRLRDREDAADAVQNTFLRVHLALERGVVPQFESAWLYKIAHNVCLSRLESGGRRARVETPHDLDQLDDSLLAAPETEQDALAGLAEALAALPLNLRQAILLREWQGLSYAEIAAAMDTTVPAVETLLYRARRQLASALGEAGKPARRVAAGISWLFGLRSLLRRGSSRISGTLSGASAKTVATAALVTLGGSGFGAAVAITHSSPAPAAAAKEVAVAAATPKLAGAFLQRLGLAALRPSSSVLTSRPNRSAPEASSADVSGSAASVQPNSVTNVALTGLSAAVPDAASVPALPAVSVATPAVPSLPSVPSVPAVPTVPVAPPVVAVPSVPAVTTIPPAPALPSVTATSLLPGG